MDAFYLIFKPFFNSVIIIITCVFALAYYIFIIKIVHHESARLRDLIKDEKKNVLIIVGIYIILMILMYILADHTTLFRGWDYFSQICISFWVFCLSLIILSEIEGRINVNIVNMGLISLITFFITIFWIKGYSFFESRIKINKVSNNISYVIGINLKRYQLRTSDERTNALQQIQNNINNYISEARDTRDGDILIAHDFNNVIFKNKEDLKSFAKSIHAKRFIYWSPKTRSNSKPISSLNIYSILSSIIPLGSQKVHASQTESMESPDSDSRDSITIGGIEKETVSIKSKTNDFSNISSVEMEFQESETTLKTDRNDILINFTSYYAAGLACFNLERYSCSARYFSEALDIIPDTDNIITDVHRGALLRMLGISEFKMGNLKESHKHLEEAINYNKSDIFAFIFNISVKHKLDPNYYEKGIIDLNRAFELASDDKKLQSRILFREGVMHSNENEYDEAIKSYDRAIALDKNFYKAWNNLGVCYIKKGEQALIDSSGSIFQMLVNRDNTSAIPIYNLGCYYSKIGEYTSLVNLFKEHIEILEKVTPSGLGPVVPILYAREDPDFDNARKYSIEFNKLLNYGFEL